ncbi:IMP dehydrogenase [Candidatus Woesearchaeota archaeon]|nr:IMP dehydrogenase [Candidatus Woesearchaeota archaeon]
MVSNIREGLTYSDVLLVPKKTPLSSRKEANTESRFTRNIHLNSPLASANMATVTEHKMAIALAREGGIGVIHQFNTIDEQVEEVKKVKRSTCYMIENPLSIGVEATLEEAVKVMNKQNVTSLIVKGSSGELKGIFTRRDYLFEEDLSKKISDVMTSVEKLVTADPSITLDKAKDILHKHRIEKLPILKDGKVVGLVTTQDIVKLETWPNASRDKKGRLIVAAAVGVKDTLERAEALIKAGADVIVIDIAHAHSDLMIGRIKELKEKFPKTDVMAGNIATAEAAEDLIKAGADGLKVGVGPSPVCSTRQISGAGVPQLTAVMDVCSIAKKYDIPVTADGGLKTPGDVAKAIAAGASTIFSGTLFAGTDEAPGPILAKDGKRYKRYMGSASYSSNLERKEKLEQKQYKDRIDVFVEGVSILVDYKGPVSEVISSLMKGLRSGISYCGAHDIKEMQKNAEFIRITSAGWQETITQGTRNAE